MTRVPAPVTPKVKALTPAESVAAEICRVSSKHYLEAGLPNLTFGSSLQDVLQKNDWHFSKSGDEKDTKSLMPCYERHTQASKRFRFYLNSEITDPEFSRGTVLLFDGGKLRWIERSYHYTFWSIEHRDGHAQEVVRTFGKARPENTVAERMATGGLRTHMTHWFPQSLVFRDHKSDDLRLGVYDRQWLEAELAARLEEEHLLLLLAAKLVKARSRYSPVNGVSPASVLPTAEGFRRTIKAPTRPGYSWGVEYTPSGNSLSSRSVLLEVPDTAEGMQSRGGRNWLIRFYSADTTAVERVLYTMPVAKAGLLYTGFQKLFLRTFPPVKVLEHGYYSTTDGFVAMVGERLFCMPPPPPTRGL